MDALIEQEVYKIRVWGSVDKASHGVALLVHGLGAHSGWFEAAARQLSARGFLVLAYDQRGFGSRTSSVLHSQKEWIDDLASLVSYLRIQFAGLPIYLMGNSMGALVVTAASASAKPDGIVIFSPGFDGHPETFTIAYKLKSVISALISPQKMVALPFGFEIATRSNEVLEWLKTDELKQVAVPGSMLFELLKLSLSVLRNLNHLSVPVLMITAGKERVVDNKASEKLFAGMKAPSKKHIHMKEAWHDLMFDPQVDEVADEIVIWQDQLKKNPVKSAQIG